MEPKPWYFSKLVLTGIIEAAYGIYELVKDGSITEGDIQATALIIAGVATIIFRVVTNQPVANRVI